MEPSKKLPARFYRNTKGDEPVREWLKNLMPQERRVIGKDVQKVEFGWPLGLPVCRPLGQGLWKFGAICRRDARHGSSSAL